MKYQGRTRRLDVAVAPVRGRGLKYPVGPDELECCLVAPVRGRGLKLFFLAQVKPPLGRPREGAWIEIATSLGGS